MNDQDNIESDDRRKEGPVSKRDQPRRGSKGKVDETLIGDVPDSGSQEQDDSSPVMGIDESEVIQSFATKTSDPVSKPRKKRSKPYKEDPNIESVPLEEFGFFCSNLRCASKNLKFRRGRRRNCLQRGNCSELESSFSSEVGLRD